MLLHEVLFIILFGFQQFLCLLIYCFKILFIRFIFNKGMTAQDGDIQQGTEEKLENTGQMGERVWW